MTYLTSMNTTLETAKPALLEVADDCQIRGIRTAGPVRPVNMKTTCILRIHDTEIRQNSRGNYFIAVVRKHGKRHLPEVVPHTETSEILVAAARLLDYAARGVARSQARRPDGVKFFPIVAEMARMIGKRLKHKIKTAEPASSAVRWMAI